MKHKLTELTIRNARPQSKAYKLYDGGGLLLLIHPNGGKYWSFRYRWLGKDKVLSLGAYPDISLSEARNRRDEAQQHLKENRDPGHVKKAQKLTALIALENTFEPIAHEWMESRKNLWTPRYAEFMKRRLEADIFPVLGKRPIHEITPPELLSTVRQIEARGALELAHRVLNVCGMVFMFAIATGRATQNPALHLRGALKAPVRKHFAHFEIDHLPTFFERLEEASCAEQTRIAIKLLMLTMLRTVELRSAKWSEIDFAKAEWRVPLERMKKRRPHIVPLSKEAIILLKELKLQTGRWEYLFPNQFRPIKCMSENTILYALYRMGYHSKMTGHGFRHVASTILNEHEFPKDYIEKQLAHRDQSTVRATYNHAEYLTQRRAMMQWWADYLVGKGMKVGLKGAIHEAA